MQKIEFFDRDMELNEIRSILEAEPSLITFIYGSINSGKTELMNYLLKKPENYRIFYINLRGRYIERSEEFLNILFEIRRESTARITKTFIKQLIKSMPQSCEGIPVPKEIFLRFFEERKVDDAFKYIEDIFRAFYDKNVPVLIIDELQVIGDIKTDDLLIYKLFNFLVRLTKELHIAHVFAVSSDSLFIEQIHSEAMLQGRCRYLLVDDFDYETTRAFLGKYGFSEEEKEIAWNFCGGKPVYLKELVRAKSSGRDVGEKAKQLLAVRKSQLKSLLRDLDYVSPVVTIRGEEKVVDKEAVLSALMKFKDAEVVDSEIDLPAKIFLIKENILFFDPVSGAVKPQSRLDLLAILRFVRCFR